VIGFWIGDDLYHRVLKAAGEKKIIFYLKIPVQRRYAIRWNRLLADNFFASLSEALEGVYATIWRGRNGQGS
jgi:hypothetical protein